MREVCWWITVWGSVVSFFRTGDVRSWTSGHAYVETEDVNVLARVTVLRCVRCGHYSIGWEPVAERPTGKATP
jgi:hypothetical protein